MLEVDEGNFMDRFMNFVTWNYGDIIDVMGKKYPYKTPPDRDDHFSQASLWAACKMVNTATGTTILDEFTDRFVRGSRLKSRILLLKEMEHDLFSVLECRGVLITAASRTGKGIICLETEEHVARDLVPGLEFAGLVHPWNGGKTHRIVGAVHVTQIAFNSNSESAMARLGSGNLPSGVSLLQLLQNYSLLDLEGTCDNLGIDPSGMGHARMAQEISKTLTTDRVRRILEMLTPAARDCLAYIARGGGLAEYSDLQERFGRGFEDMLDELEYACLVARIAFRQQSTVFNAAYMAPDLLAAMYRLGCLGLKRWQP